jgi:hypothetical protein
MLQSFFILSPFPQSGHIQRPAGIDVSHEVIPSSWSPHQRTSAIHHAVSVTNVIPDFYVLE